MTTLTLCRSCPAGQTGLEARLKAAIAAQGLDVAVAGAECMSG